MVNLNFTLWRIVDVRVAFFRVSGRVVVKYFFRVSGSKVRFSGTISGSENWLSDKKKLLRIFRYQCKVTKNRNTGQ